MKPAWVVKCQGCGEIADPDTRKIKHRWTAPHPTEDELMEMVMDQLDCWCTDGCEPIEQDGICEHGHQSVMRAMGLI